MIRTRRLPLDRLNARMCARQLGLVLKLDRDGRVVAWVNPPVLERLSARSTPDSSSRIAPVESAPPRPPTVKSRNLKDGLITLSRPVTQEDSIALTHSLNAFTSRHGLPKAVVGSGVSAMIIGKLLPLTGDLQAAFEQWFKAECDRIDRGG